MDLLSRFKKDYLNYLISIILPAFIGGISVPVFKHLLGAEGYGNFAIYYNAALIGTAITTGWITQSIYRFYPSITNKNLFVKLSIALSKRTQLFFFLPVILFVWYFKSDMLLGILVCVAIFMNAMQFAFIAIAQSSFLSKKTIYSETIRAVSYIVIALILLLLTPPNYLYVLFIANIISYALSVYYLRSQTRVFFIQNKSQDTQGLTFKRLARQFFKYGAPLSMWVVFAYLLPYIDKVLILHNLGAQVQGNYQALFDLLFRGLTVLISPVLISLLPLLTQAYEKEKISEIRQLLKKIILFELGGFLVSSILYWWFGAKLVFIILKIPDTISYRLMGFVIILGTFIWQIAMVVHQRYVLKMKSLYLLCMIAAAFCSQLIFYWFVRKSVDPLIYPLGYLIAATMYLFFISVSQLPKLLKSLFICVKNYFAK